MTGRPRDTELEARLLRATWSLLTTERYDGLTLAKVATGAQAHRTDVYRRWSSKAHLVADALAHHLPAVPVTDTGSLRGDLQRHLEHLAAVWSADWVDGLMGLVADLHDDPDAELAFRQMAVQRGAELRAILQRARERGEISETADVSLASDLLEGALMHRRLIGREALLPVLLDALLDTVVAVLSERVPS